MFRQLVEELRAKPPLRRTEREIGQFLGRVASAWGDGPRLISRSDTYTRTCVYSDENFEMLLLNWAAGAASAIHDHGDQHCWMLVLAGQLEVEDYVRLDPGDVPGYAHVQEAGRRVLAGGGVDARSGRFDLHRVSSAGASAVSLHVYSGPLRRYLVYDALSRRCETAIGTYDDVLSLYSGAHR